MYSKRNGYGIIYIEYIYVSAIIYSLSDNVLGAEAQAENIQGPEAQADIQYFFCHVTKIHQYFLSCHHDSSTICVMLP